MDLNQEEDCLRPARFFVSSGPAIMLVSENANHWLGPPKCSQLLQKFRPVRPAADRSKKHRMADSAA
jgi:hypothetical protein